MYRADMAIIRNAAALLAKGDRKTAAKVLFSLGTAPRTSSKATADALQKLQVRTIATFDTPALPDDIAQVDSNFSASDLYKCNLKKAAHKGTAHGFYGWSDDLFFPIAGRKASAPNNIIWQLSRLQHYYSSLLRAAFTLLYVMLSLLLRSQPSIKLMKPNSNNAP
jgi:hypothetical protein